MDDDLLSRARLLIAASQQSSQVLQQLQADSHSFLGSTNDNVVNHSPKVPSKRGGNKSNVRASTEVVRDSLDVSTDSLADSRSRKATTLNASVKKTKKKTSPTKTSSNGISSSTATYFDTVGTATNHGQTLSFADAAAATAATAGGGGGLDGITGAVFKGSTLVNITRSRTDIRQLIKRGDALLIDGIRCVTSLYGQWAANCIELSHDFPGNTNLQAGISLENPDGGNGRKPKRHVAIPVPSENIASAVEGLDEIKSLRARLMALDQYNTSSNNINNSSSNNEAKGIGGMDTTTAPGRGIRGGAGKVEPRASSALRPPRKRNESTLLPVPLSIDHRCMEGGGGCGGGKERNGEVEREEVQRGVEDRVAGQIADIAASRENVALSHKRAMDRVREKKEKEAKRREEEIRMQEEQAAATAAASAAKADALRERTLARVTRYKEQLQQQEQLKKEALVKEAEEREARAQAQATEEKRARLAAVSRQAAIRLQRIEQEDARRHAEKEVQMQMQLQQRARKFEASTTFRPNQQPRNTEIVAENSQFRSLGTNSSGTRGGSAGQHFPPVVLRSKSRQSPRKISKMGAQNVSEKGSKMARNSSANAMLQSPNRNEFPNVDQFISNGNGFGKIDQVLPDIFAPSSSSQRMYTESRPATHILHKQQYLQQQQLGIDSNSEDSLGPPSTFAPSSAVNSHKLGNRASRAGADQRVEDDEGSEFSDVTYDVENRLQNGKNRHERGAGNSSKGGAGSRNGSSSGRKTNIPSFRGTGGTKPYGNSHVTGQNGRLSQSGAGSEKMGNGTILTPHCPISIHPSTHASSTQEGEEMGGERSNKDRDKDKSGNKKRPPNQAWRKLKPIPVAPYQPMLPTPELR